jgi:hypothetical protein
VVPAQTVLDTSFRVTNTGGGQLMWSAVVSPDDGWLTILPENGVKAWLGYDDVHTFMTAGTLKGFLDNAELGQTGQHRFIREVAGKPGRIRRDNDVAGNCAVTVFFDLL